jgi:hypothetical protein
MQETEDTTMTSRRSSREKVAEWRRRSISSLMAAVLFDIGVRVGDVRLRLVVVVVGDEIFHGVVGEKLLELAAQLGGQRLVVGQHQRGALHLLDDLGHGIGLAGAGDAQQHLLGQAVFNALTPAFRWPPAGRRRAGRGRRHENQA